MTVKEFYEKVNGDYVEVSSRLVNDDIIKRFIMKFPNDKSYNTLVQGVDENDAEKAFMAAHTLKGVTISLGLGSLNLAAAEITELLRNASVADTAEIKASLAEVKEIYNETLALIKKL